ncbi:aminotransferase [Edaphobacter acidisoli]|uniref:Aminotransferase n=1 Tax=Edaphobacter acidisoli TaxID=2040573 RepID=A0A916RL44_9BACT|nr:alanine transaminase [Edaphobacter acidisoli]GGA57881.1 aminotransferase [Edaphobacter acidisoli]
MDEFRRLTRLPAYVFNITGELKASARKRGEDIIDFGMGNPDGATPKFIVDKLIEAAQKTVTHRYSLSRGIPRLRKAITNWYKSRYDVDLDPETEAIVTIGSKEGIAHLCLAVLDDTDTVAVPNPSYPIHIFGPVIAGSKVQSIAMEDGGADALLAKLEYELPRMQPRPKLLILNFPANPTTQCVDLAFFERVVALCKELGIYIVHDLAYADIVFDGYRAPSVLEVPGAKDIAVEFFTLSKSYNMPGWRVGFMVGNKKLVAALGRIKSYFDYGTFTPIQVASIAALEGPQDCVAKIRDTYRSRRDVLVSGLNKLGWPVELPKATMFVWARIPEQYRGLGSVEFSKKLLLEAKTAVSPGIGFGDHGDGHVRFSLIENEERTRQALRGIKQMFKNGV